MTKGILGAIVTGLLAGYLASDHVGNTAGAISISGNIIWLLLFFLLFFVGISMGTEGDLIGDLKKAGYRILLFPFAAIAGTLIGTGIVGILLGFHWNEGMAIGCGFGWCTLAPILLIDHSVEISAISFIHNLMRELFGILLIPIVAERIGYVECTALPGVAASDICIPIVAKCTEGKGIMYSIAMGIIFAFSVPILVPLLIGL